MDEKSRIVATGAEGTGGERRIEGLLSLNDTGGSGGKTISVILVDNHVAVREALLAGLSYEKGVNVVATADNAENALPLVFEFLPDVVLMDIDMPGLSSFDAARQIQLQSPGTRVLFLSAFCHDSYIAQALEIEAAGYLVKGESLDVIVKAIKAVGSGKTYYSAEVQERIVVGDKKARLGSVARTRLSTLTAREYATLRHIAMGKAKKEIAEIDNVSVKTVDNHAASLMKKLGIHDRVELASFAIREGIIRP